MVVRLFERLAWVVFLAFVVTGMVAIDALAYSAGTALIMAPVHVSAGVALVALGLFLMMEPTRP